uniref:Putative secreted protein n=1 Tax=Panstrongylus lignarius TaxID=156445 RepID=A0A224XQW9_9HEMI
MMLTSFMTCLLLGVCCITTGVQGRLFWDSYDPFEKLLHPSGGGEGSGGSNSPTESSPNPASSLHKAPAEASPDTSAANKYSETDIRKLIEEELKKYQASSGKSAKWTKYSLDSTSEPAKTTTENSADLFRRIIAEELAKALPQTPPPTTPSSSPSSPPEPLWKQWAKTKKWAKQPGPDGQAAPGFLGTLRGRYGAAGGYGRASGETPASGSPGWVWSQIAYKWAKKDPTVVPPSQVVDNGDWIVMQPPKQPEPTPAKS